jgi:Chaperone of endosialidase
MKNLLLTTLAILVFLSEIKAQVGINATNSPPHPSAMLDVNSTTKGLLIPRMSTADKNNIFPKPAGLMVYDNNLNRFQNWNGVTWTGNEWTTVGNDIVNFNSGNVGVGNGAPLNKLTVGSTISPFAGNDFAIGNSLGGGMSLYQSGGTPSGASIWYSNANFALMPVGGGAGSVGINYTNPSARLDIFQTGKPQTGFGSLIRPMRIGIGVTGSHAVVGDNYDAIGIAGFGANASGSKRNVGVLGTSDVSGTENIGIMGYQEGTFSNYGVYGGYFDVRQLGTSYTTGVFSQVVNSFAGTSTGSASVVYNQANSGNSSSYGVSSSCFSSNSNTSAANYAVYAYASGAGTNYGVLTEAVGGVTNYALKSIGNTWLNGNVAIGLTAVPALPKAQLVVTGFNAATNTNYSYFVNTQNAITVSTISTNNSIYATHNIVSGALIGAAQTVTTSDSRIKKDFSLSNNSEDLERLKKIQITNYRMKDVATWGTQTFKKVIAQQVEEVYPEVISKTKSVIPDIYALAESVVYDAQDKKLNVSLSKDYGIKIGDKIELVHPEKGKIQTEVVEVSDKSFTVKNWEYATDKIFVFGREVNDFRSVDYEALSMLGISAIQQLAKENEDMKKENAKQKENFTKRLESIEASLKSMNQATIK